MSAICRPKRSRASGRPFILKVVFDPIYETYQTGPGHPERAERLAAFVEGLEAGGLSRSSFAKPTPATSELLASVHPAAYVELVERACEQLKRVPGALADLPTGDTVISQDSFAIALQAAGGAIRAAADAIPDAPTLAVIRPPGHHAEPRRGMGFCIFNNVALAAAWALRERGNVLIADFDYHHGNGTQAWVETLVHENGPKLGFISTHAYPAYPGTGAFRESQVTDRGFIVDIPLAHSTQTDDFIAAWSSLLPIAALRIQPRTIIVSAGFDFLAGDPIAGLPIGPRAVDALCALLGAVSAACHASLVFVLEGGYSLDNLRKSGASLAYDFGKHASDVHVPHARLPQDQHLAAMIGEVQRWL